ncbi:MAG TPA: Rne/Rng family ribonuclease [Pyrinomonadaceae bacterium]|nr:Rne/Rng family ribonuclease [Pyrinomonadaceae bacterium]
MAKELIVSVNGREKKIAIIENDQVTEFYIERGEDNQGIVGNIYKGRVMRVLPGMQSAFVDVGLERDAFLYVSDFFDEEEEFERIVMDKAKKGEVDADKAAAEQIALGRVEREHRIEAAQERVEPLRDSEAIQPVEAVAESTDTVRRRSRRGGRRRGRGKDGAPEPVISPEGAVAPGEDQVETPLTLRDPSIQRIVDDEETATNGEMFKDARLQERIFDQIHAVEFNFEDDFRTAEVGSILPASYRDQAFQRVADDDDSDAPQITMRALTPEEAHLSSFVDNVREDTLNSGSFQRISDDEELLEVPPVLDDEEFEEEEAEPEKHGFAARAVEKIVSVAKGKRGAKKSPARSTKSRGASKKAVTRKTVTEAVTGDEATEAATGVGAEETFEDAEARISAGRSRGEFATRRGGRRRRRPAAKKGAASGNGADEEATEVTETAAETEVMEAPEPQEVSEPLAVEPAPRERSQSGRGPRGGGGARRDRQKQPTITDLLDEGQEILVQIAKEPIAKKGARITSHIALPGRFLVYMPTVEHVGVSRKIESDSERHRLRKLIQILRAEEDIPSGGFIVRTAGVGISEADLREDVRYLVRTWLDIRAAAEKSKPATLVHRDLDLVQRILRDQLSDDFAAIRVDSEEEYESIVEFINRIQPRMVKRVKLYTREEPILEHFGVQAEIDKAIKPRVWLKSGGYLVINQTEALVAIDVNTGKFVGRGSGRLEDTITRTNLEAVEEIVRQIRLRDLGGIIVLDLIDMEERRNRTKVMQVLQDALRGDKSPTKVLSFNDFGLVIMTRKRVKQSLERTLCAPCQYCQGAGLIKSPQTVCYELLEEARRLGKHMNGGRDNKQATVRVNPEVARALRGSERDVLNEIEEYLGPVDINSDQTIHQEQFDFAFV